MRKTCLHVLKILIVGVLIFSTTFGNLNRSFSFTSHNVIIVQAEDISTAEKEGLAALITWLLANGMRFAADSADTIYQGMNNLWNNFKTASGTAATLAGLTTYITFKNGKTRFQEGFATIANAFQKYIMDAYYLDYGTSQSFDIEVSSSGTYAVASSCFRAFGPLNGVGNSLYCSIWDNEAEVRVVAITQSNTGGFPTRNLCTLSLSPYKKTYEYTDGSAVCNYNVSINISQESFNNVIYYCSGAPWTSNAAGYFYDIPHYEQITGLNAMETAYKYTYGDLALNDQVVSEGQTNNLVDGYNPSDGEVVSTDTDNLQTYVGYPGSITNADDLQALIDAAITKGIAEGIGSIPWDLLKQQIDQKTEDEVIEEVTPTEASKYKTLGLEKVFPFSIPVDIVLFFKMFESDPVTPVFPFVLKVPGIIDYSQDIGLDMFDGVATITRNMELLAFILGLILLTRGIIGG